MTLIKESTMDNQTKSPDSPLLSIQGLHVWFELKRWGFAHAGYVRAVDNVNFNLGRGDALAIVGESGSGKTSLMKTILGLNRPHKGDIIFDGQNLTELSAREIREYRSKIGFVQQDPYGALPPFMNVHRILAEPLIINGIKDPDEREQRVRKVMEEVRLLPVDDFIEKFPHMLSGGQQQRVVIARAMILEPKLIVADEPVSMLDASVRVEILKLLENLQQTHNLAVIYITHDLSTVRNNAKIFKEIPPGEPPSLVNPPKGCRFHPRCSKMIDGVCNVYDPVEREIEPSHYVTCWLHDDLPE